MILQKECGLSKMNVPNSKTSSYFFTFYVSLKHKSWERTKARTMSTTINGHKHESERIAHTEEKHLPGGWQVLKFGGTSVGKFAGNIADIVKCVALSAFRSHLRPCES